MRHLSKKMAEVLHNQEPPFRITAMYTLLEYTILDREFDILWSRFGFKSMVCDRRRRCSTRKSNQNFQKVKRRAEKRHEHQIAVRSWIAELADDG